MKNRVVLLLIGATLFFTACGSGVKDGMEAAKNDPKSKVESVAEAVEEKVESKVEKAESKAEKAESVKEKVESKAEKVESKVESVAEKVESKVEEVAVPEGPDALSDDNPLLASLRLKTEDIYYIYAPQLNVIDDALACRDACCIRRTQ